MDGLLQLITRFSFRYSEEEEDSQLMQMGRTAIVRRDSRVLSEINEQSEGESSPVSVIAEQGSVHIFLLHSFVILKTVLDFSEMHFQNYLESF